MAEALADAIEATWPTSQSGPMGALAAHALKKRGFTDVAFLDGGSQCWLNAGYTTHR